MKIKLKLKKREYAVLQVALEELIVAGDAAMLLSVEAIEAAGGEVSTSEIRKIAEKHFGLKIPKLVKVDVGGREIVGGLADRPKPVKAEKPKAKTNGAAVPS
jgi:hypothetical protein